MKVLVAILTLLSCVCADDWTVKNKEQWKAIRTECLIQHPLTDAQMTKLKHLEYPNEELIRKYLLCKAVKFGIFDTDHGYYVDRIAKQFKQDLEEGEVKKFVEDCIAKYPRGDKSDDVTVFEVHSCLANKIYVRKSLQN